MFILKQQKIKTTRSESGFTLIEVTIITVIIAIVTAMAMQILNGFKTKAFENIALKSAAQLRTSFEAFQTDSGDFDVFAENRSFMVHFDTTKSCESGCTGISDVNAIFPGFSPDRNVRILFNSTTGNSYSMVAVHCQSRTADETNYNGWSLTDFDNPEKVASAVGGSDACISG